MRTAEQGQASRSAGEGRAAEGEGACLGPHPGPWDNIPRTVTNRGALSSRRPDGWGAGFKSISGAPFGCAFFVVRRRLLVSGENIT